MFISTGGENMVEDAIILTGDDLEKYKKMISKPEVEYNKEWLVNERTRLLEENKKLQSEHICINRRDIPIQKKIVNNKKFCPICNYPIDRNVPAQHYCAECGQALKAY